jgi:hypothetical protein
MPSIARSAGAVSPHAFSAAIATATFGSGSVCALHAINGSELSPNLPPHVASRPQAGLERSDRCSV